MSASEPPEPTVITLGCRLNAYEAEVMRDKARAAGLGETIIVNTCAVTGEAVRQAMQTIRRQRREHPGARIVVTGCAAQIEPDRFAAMAEVDHVVGNDEKTRAETWAGLRLGASARIQVGDIMRVRETASHLVAGFPAKARAFVEVQNGCDHRCTFCIIPFGRGPSRSVPAGEVVAQIRKLVEAGYLEVVLTGVDLTSYGGDLPGAPTLGRLVGQILRHVPELGRLRLSSIDQVEADADLLRAIAEEERLMPHLHLSMQAGSDMILKRMKRRHLAADAIRFCDEVRRLRPDIALGADLIAGFPTETEAMFQETLDVAERCGLAYLHVFPYSPRPGTPAARMPQVARPLVKERAERLRHKGAVLLDRHLSGQVGRIVGAMMERDGQGRADDYAEIDVPHAKTGTVVAARVMASNGQRLSGEVVT